MGRLLTRPFEIDVRLPCNGSSMSLRPTYTFSANSVGVLPVTWRNAWENAGTLA